MKQLEVTRAMTEDGSVVIVFEATDVPPFALTLGDAKELARQLMEAVDEEECVS